jgi:hypothetical protein
MQPVDKKQFPEPLDVFIAVVTRLPDLFSLFFELFVQAGFFRLCPLLSPEK